MSAAHGSSRGLHDGVLGQRAVLDQAHEAFIAMDAVGLVIDWNAQAQRTFGWSAEEAIGRTVAELIIPPRYRAAHTRGLRAYLDGGHAKMLDRRVELSAVDRTGRGFPIELTISRDATVDGPDLRFFAFLHDISDRRLSERLLRAQHAVTRVFAETQHSSEVLRGLLAALGGAMGWQLGAAWCSEDARDVLCCRSVWRSDSRLAADFEAVTLKLELASGVGLAGRVWASGEPAWTAGVPADPSFRRARVLTHAGMHSAMCVPVLAGGEFCGALEFFSAQAGLPDVATRQILDTIAAEIAGFMSLLEQRSQRVAKLERLALTDELTGLANRHAWQQSLARELARARRHHEPLCVAMLDIDHFKRFNDAHGHQAGDGLLRELAQTWRGQLRASDTLARYGGDEFSLLFPATPITAAETVLGRVRAATPRSATCCAGLALFNGRESAHALIGRADAALYEAKALGRNRTVTAGGDKAGCADEGGGEGRGS